MLDANPCITPYLMVEVSTINMEKYSIYRIEYIKNVAMSIISQFLLLATFFEYNNQFSLKNNSK